MWVLALAGAVILGPLPSAGAAPTKETSSVETSGSMLVSQRAGVAVTNPKANLTPPCSYTWWVAIDCAHKDEGLPPLPSSLQALKRLSHAEQVFALTNFERIQRGLPALQWMTVPLDTAAQIGAETGADPHISTPYLWDSNWIGGDGVTAIWAMFVWMYNDGFGSQNLDCTSPTDPGCWGHRDDILYTFGSCYTGPGQLELGAAQVTNGPGWGHEVTEILQLACSPTVSTAVVSWSQVEAVLGILPSFGAYDRVYGQTAPATAAAEFEHQFSSACPGDTATTRPVVLATDVTYPDALASAYLESYLGTGLLLTTPTTLSRAAAEAIEAEGVTKVYVVGGPAAVSTGVLEELGSMTATGCGQDPGGGPISVTRIFGPTAYTTAASIAGVPPSSAVGTADVSGAYGSPGAYDPVGGAASPSGPSGAVPTAILASGRGFSDAEAASALSYAEHLPILLTPPGSLGPQAQRTIGALGIKQVIVMGGPAAISTTVVGTLEGLGLYVVRVAGKTSVETATELASMEEAQAPQGFAWTASQGVVLARGDFYSDGLAGAVVAADGPTSSAPEPLLLSASPTTPGIPLLEYVASASRPPARVVVLGGPGAVSPSLVDMVGAEIGVMVPG